MEPKKKIGFAGTDGRTFLSAFTVSTAISEYHKKDYLGVVIRGTSSMPEFAKRMNWPIEFIPTKDNTVDSYAQAIVSGIEQDKLDFVIPLPEALLFDGLVDLLISKGFGDKITGLTKEFAFLEGDKARCKEVCKQAGIPVADKWKIVDAKSYKDVLDTCLEYIHQFGGAVLKYPYSAGGKGARIILNTWEINEVYSTLMNDYKKSYKALFKNKPWPLLIESRMSGVEISFTILVDKKGNHVILPTAMDYPERFEGTADKKNPITGGMGAISPHPFETPELISLVEDTIANPIIKYLKENGGLRPCVLYPGCFVSFKLSPTGELIPTKIRVCEINIRPGEPEFQAVVKRIRNLGHIIEGMFTGELDQIKPEVRQDQICLCMALVTGPGGPDGQKGYPWSVTKFEPLEIDIDYFKKKGIQLIPSGMGYSEEKGFFSDGTRIIYMVCNGQVKENLSPAQIAERLRNKLINAYEMGKVRVIPREDPKGNRLDLRKDIGIHYTIAERLGLQK